MNLQIIEIDSWNAVPKGLLVRGYYGSLDLAKSLFADKYGYDCKAAFKLGNQYWMVIDPAFRVEVE